MSQPLPSLPGEPARPGCQARLLAAAFYLGVAPVLRPLRQSWQCPFIQHHTRQAGVLVLLLLAFVAGYFLYWAFLTYAILHHSDLYRQLPLPEGWSPPMRDIIPPGIVLLIWLLAWGGGLILALCGSMRSLPLIARLVRRPRVLLAARVGHTLLCVAVLFLAVTAVYAASLTRQDDEPAAVYLLYDDMGFVPRWVFNVGFCRIARAATARWGPGSVVVAPLDEHHLRLALRHGRFVFLACHGTDGYIQAPRLWIAPPGLLPSGKADLRCLWVAHCQDADHCGPWTLLEVGKSVQFVYVAACDSGSRAKQWEGGLAPAEVKTFSRLSTVAEHIAWLWLDGPDRVRAIEEP